MTPRRFILAAVFSWCALIAAAPLLASLGGVASGTAAFLYDLFSRVCHQFDSRSFHIAGFKFAVCIRCFSIYFSFFLGILFSPLIRRTRIAAVSSSLLLIASLMPMGLDVALATLGIHNSNAASRVVTGLLFGLALSIVLLPVLEEVSAAPLRRLIASFNSSKSPSVELAVAQTPGSNLRNLPSALNLRHLPFTLNLRHLPLTLNLRRLPFTLNLRNLPSAPNLRHQRNHNDNPQRTSYAIKTR